MDIITRLKNFLDKLYSNKIFKIFLFLIFLTFVFYKYTNIRGGINSIKNKNTSEEIPQKINAIKQAQNTFYLKLNQKQEENKKTKEAIKNMKIREQQEAARERRLKKLQLEFMPQTNKNGQILKLNDTVNIKMLTTNGEYFTVNNRPIEFTFQLNKVNPFTENLINKRVGDVVLINAKDFFKNKLIKSNMDRMKKTQGMDKKFDDMVDNMNIIYRIKILSIANNSK